MLGITQSMLSMLCQPDKKMDAITTGYVSSELNNVVGIKQLLNCAENMGSMNRT